MSGAWLRTRNVSKHFGGLFAVDGVSLDFKPGVVHAVIGPNGAGKTTLVNLLSGDLLPSAGHILYEERDITRLPAHRVSQLGIGRSYQRTNIFPEYTCFENCWLAAQSRLPSSMRFFRPAYRERSVRERTERSLALCGLAARREARAGSMSYGEQRQLEIGMVLATEPRVLLLDEPTAGMGRDESEGVIELLRGLSGDYTLVLIEHDMDAVFAIAQVLTVMVNGQVLETGSPEQVRESAAVKEAYLGSGEEAG